MTAHTAPTVAIRRTPGRRAGVARRVLTGLAGAAGVLLVLVVVVFIVQTVLPSDPVRAYFGRNASPELIADKRAELGLDEPVLVQFWLFLVRLVQGDLGVSLTTDRPVTVDLANYLPATLELTVAAAIVAVLLGLAIGVLSALAPRSAIAVRVTSIALASAPPFFIALLAVLVFYRWLDVLPQGGRAGADTDAGPTGFLVLDAILRLDPAMLGDALVHLLLPALTLAIGPAVAIARVLRGSLSSTLKADFIRSARARGLGQTRIVLRHGVRNAISPVLSMAGLQLGLLIAGAITVEVVFGWPGIGSYLFAAIKASDFPAIMGVVLVLGVLYVIINAIVDALQVWADPRQRSST